MKLSKAAERLGVSEDTVREWGDSGYLEVTGYFGDYFVTDASVSRFAKAIDRYKIRKHERTRRKDRDRVVPDYYIRLQVAAERLNLPSHQARLLATKHAFGARKVNGWWVLDGGLIDLFVLEHQGEKLNSAAKIVAQLKEDENAEQGR